jgi:exopolysaccharide production protein ExoQ
VPPILASALTVVGVAALFLLSSVRGTRLSPALWLSITWVSVGASRMFSQWFESGTRLDSPDQYLDGSPVDRFILTALLVAAIGVLISRSEKTKGLLQRNIPLVLFFTYCLVSAIWSDFPFVAFKRWTKALGNVAMVLVVLTDVDPVAALRQFLARVGFLLIPTSVLFIKYFPDIGRSYDRWTGTAYFNGVAVGKNGLGSICLVFGLASLWLFMTALATKPRPLKQVTAYGIALVMVLWLLTIAESATSIACFVIGSTLMLALFVIGRPRLIHAAIATCALVAIVGFSFLHADVLVIQALGRDATLTGRTELWADVLTMNVAPLVGTGFESFWLGDRAEFLWSKYWWHPNQAHNGYIEVYLNLGLVGLALLSLLIISGYRNVFKTFRHTPSIAALKLAFLLATLFYNFTEAAFKVMHPVWIAFLFAVVADPVFSDTPSNLAVRSATPTTPSYLKVDRSRDVAWRRAGHVSRQTGRTVRTSRTIDDSRQPRPIRCSLD